MSQPKKTVLITGAGGFLGSELIKQLISQKTYKIIAISSNKDKLNYKFRNNVDFICFDIHDWKDDRIPFDTIDVLINCAFARSFVGQEIAKSLDFINEFISDAAKKGVGSIINISSQSIYSQQRKYPATEEMIVNPESLYGMAKYSSELLVDNICKSYNIPVTNIRLASLVGFGSDKRLINRFVNQVVRGEPIRIIGGKQILSYMDVRDASAALIALACTESEKWKPIYNLGVHEYYTIIEIANLIKRIAPKFTTHSVEIQLENGNDFLNLSLNCTKLYEDMLWKPIYNMNDTIVSMFEYIKYVEPNLAIDN